MAREGLMPAALSESLRESAEARGRGGECESEKWLHAHRARRRGVTHSWMQ